MIETSPVRCARVPLRLEPVVHPYTLDGWRCTASCRTRVEILECGRAHPELLAGQGWPPVSDGIGLDRMLMLRKGIDDIRALRSSDPRIQAQMLDLQPYREVSSQPPIYRDLSIAVAAEANAEELGGPVRSASPLRAAASNRSTCCPRPRIWSCRSQHVGGWAIAAAQKNVLLRFGDPDLDRTLTSAEANELRDAVYAVLHEGSVTTWASKEMQHET
jgi:phenylalanyl-tRNA synthetase alpha chain